MKYLFDLLESKDIVLIENIITIYLAIGIVSVAYRSFMNANIDFFTDILTWPKYLTRKRITRQMGKLKEFAKKYVTVHNMLVFIGVCAVVAVASTIVGCDFPS